MTLENQSEQPVAGGWLAYCARARDLQIDENAKRDNRDGGKRVLTEGRDLASRD